MNNSRVGTKVLSVINIVAFACTVCVNALANLLPINGKTTGELSAFYPNFFTPAGFTFSVWGVIYSFLLCFVIYQAVMAFTNKPSRQIVGSIAPYFILNCLLNACWILAWHHQLIGLSLLIILLILLTLVVIHNRLRLPYQWSNVARKFFIDVPISLYFGWITIAVIANATVMLVDLEWSGGPFSPVLWTKLIIAAGTIICVVMLVKKQNIVYALVVLWAFYGIIAQRSKNNTPADVEIIITTLICMVTILAFISITIFKYLKPRKWQ